MIFELNKIELKKLLEGKIITEEYQQEDFYHNYEGIKINELDR